MGEEGFGGIGGVAWERAAIGKVAERDARGRLCSLMSLASYTS